MQNLREQVVQSGRLACLLAVSGSGELICSPVLSVYGCWPDDEDRDGVRIGERNNGENWP